MIADFDELMNEEEKYSDSIRKADDRFMETLRKRAFPTPSPFGVEWEKQRVIEAYNLIGRWSEGRKETPFDLKNFREETLRIISVVLKRGVYPQTEQPIPLPPQFLPTEATTCQTNDSWGGKKGRH
jgi:hypothetical protein